MTKEAARNQSSFAGLLLVSSLLALGVVGGWWWYRAENRPVVTVGGAPGGLPGGPAPTYATVTSVAQALSVQPPDVHSHGVESLGAESSSATVLDTSNLRAKPATTKLGSGGVSMARAIVRPETPAGRGAFTARNSFGRSGAYYLPENYGERALPLVVLFHGTGADGNVALGELLPLARARSLLVVAPDSGRAPDGTATWQVGDRPGDRTPDFEHTRACLREFEALAGVRIQRRLAVGYSGGGSSAPYFATNDSSFEAFAVLHGGIFVNGFGGAARRGWFSTGQSDGWRTPTQVRAAAEQASRVGISVTIREFPGGHALALPELEAALDWWLER